MRFSSSPVSHGQEHDLGEPAGEAPRGVLDEHERDGTHDPIRELAFDTFCTEIWLYGDLASQVIGDAKYPRPCPRKTRMWPHRVLRSSVRARGLCNGRRAPLGVAAHRSNDLATAIWHRQTQKQLTEQTIMEGRHSRILPYAMARTQHHTGSLIAALAAASHWHASTVAASAHSSLSALMTCAVAPTGYQSIGDTMVQ